ncbi:HTH-type transcriptional regulator HexR [Sporomusa carbonis]|uniref:MurR/RpiR family transcriptional regulator n=1 Tax=Sporomusa carbonis TaxID=3076075 RepID=UPI003A6703E4
MLGESLFSIIRTHYHTLSSTQKLIADYVLNHSETAVLLSISDLAAECKTSETTVMRFLQKLGYSSYQVFRVKMAQELSGRVPQAIYVDIKDQEINSSDDEAKIKRKVLSSVATSIHDLNHLINDDDLSQAVSLLYQANKILFFGSGGSAVVAHDAFHKFLRLGLNVVNEFSPHLMYLHCTHTTARDVIFLVSHSGESKEVIECANLAKKNQARIIALTSYKNSTLAKLADVCFLSSTSEKKYHTDAMVSRIIQLIIVDLLYVPLVLKLGQKGIRNINKSRLAVAWTKT